MKKKLLFLLIFLLTISICAIAQPTVLGTQLVNGSYSTYNLTVRGGARFVRLQATSSASSGSRNWEFATGTAASANYSTNWRPYTSNQTLSGFNAIIDPSSAASSARYNTSFGGQSGLLPAITSNNYYTVLVGNNSAANNTMSILETSYSPTSFNTSSQSPAASSVFYGQQITVTATMSNNLSSNTGENLFLRYSTDNFASNSTVVQMSNSTGNNYTGNIPGQINGTTISYYLFTSNITPSTVTSNPANADFYSLNIYTAGGQNVGGSNFSYTVGTWSTVNTGASSFSSGLSWVGGIAPVSGSALGAVTIGDNILLDQPNTFTAISIASGKALTVNTGVSLTTSGSISGSGSLTVNGTLQINNGGSTSITPTYGTASSKLIYNQGGGSGSKISQSTEWPTSNGPKNVDIQNNTWLQLTGDKSLTGDLTITNGALQGTGALRTLTMNGTTQIITISTASGGAIYGTDNGTSNDLQLTVANGSITTWTGDATSTADDEKKLLNISIASGGSLILQRGILCKYGTFTVNGTLQINSNGYVQSNNTTNGALASTNKAATYSAGTLVYNNGGAYSSTNLEWPTSNAPTNVTIQNSGTNITLNSGKSISGTLTLTTGTITNSVANNITMGSGANVVRTSGVFAIAPIYGTSTNVTYNGTGNTSGFELTPLSGSIGNLTINSTGTYTLANAANITSLSLSNGTLADGGFTVTNTGNITGIGIHTGSGKILMTGTSSTISGVSLSKLDLNNPAGFSLTGSTTINSSITFTNGTLTLGSNTLTLNGIYPSTPNNIITNTSSSLVLNNSGAGPFNLPNSANIGNLTIASGQTYNLSNGLLLFQAL